MSHRSICAVMAAVFIVLLQGCQGISVPDAPEVSPENVSTSQNAGADSVELEVAVRHPEQVKACGFYIEVTGAMKPVSYFKASLVNDGNVRAAEEHDSNIGIFRAVARPLEPECRYTAKAYITNGINEIYSEPMSFLTAKDGGSRPGYGTDLSADGCANCYIVPAAGRYSFKATHKGCSKEALASKPAGAKVLWESFGTSEKPAVGSIVQDAVVDSDGVISFVASGKDGNAVIAALDEDGRILWSWHIWCCNGYDPMASCLTHAGTAGTIMDRNLGATGNQPGSVASLGLMYQWGRKDPFPGSASINDSVVAQTSVVWPAAIFSDPENISMDDLASIPMTYVKGSQKLNGTKKYILDASWVAIKGKNDPCPPGWHVPDGGGANIWSLATNSTGISITGDTWDNVNKGADPHLALGIQSSCWYPAGGYYNMSGILKTVGRCCKLWTCTVSVDFEGQVAEAFTLSANGKSTSRDHMSCASAVRCCKE